MIGGERDDHRCGYKYTNPEDGSPGPCGKNRYCSRGSYCHDKPPQKKPGKKKQLFEKGKLSHHKGIFSKLTMSGIKFFKFKSIASGVNGRRGKRRAPRAGAYVRESGIIYDAYLGSTTIHAVK